MQGFDFNLLLAQSRSNKLEKRFFRGPRISISLINSLKENFGNRFPCESGCLTSTISINIPTDFKTVLNYCTSSNGVSIQDLVSDFFISYVKSNYEKLKEFDNSSSSSDLDSSKDGVDI